MNVLKQTATVIAVLGLLGLTGCASNLKPASQSVGNMQSDNNAVYAPATDSSKVRTQIVHQYVPVPVPGQLMEAPSDTQSVSVNAPTQTQQSTKKAAPTKVTSADLEKTVQSANQKATQDPHVRDFFNAMMTYNFMPGAMYTIYAAPLKLTDIALQQGEKIISIAAGDTLRWQISQTYSGEGATLRQHVVVKPNQPGLTNTILITTNRRVYHLVLVSTDNDTYMVSVNWHYANSPLTFISTESQGYGADGVAPGSAATLGSPFQIDLSRMNFNYEFGMVKGDKPSWYPVRVFNDGRQTFIEFPKHFYQTDMPVLYVANNSKTYGTMVNWRIKGRYMIVDQVIQKARLQSGVKSKKNQVIVQIQHT